LINTHFRLILWRDLKGSDSLWLTVWTSSAIVIVIWGRHRKKTREIKRDLEGKWKSGRVEKWILKGVWQKVPHFDGSWTMSGRDRWSRKSRSRSLRKSVHSSIPYLYN
jgi:hypothetical protein